MATIDRLRQGIRQYQAGTGRKIDPEVLRALLAAELDSEAARQSETKRLELSERQQRLQEQSAEASAEAAKLSGGVQTAGTAIQAGYLLKDTALGNAVKSGVGETVSGVGNLFTASSAGGGPAALAGGSAGGQSASLAAAEAGSSAGAAGGSGGAGTAAAVAALVAADQIFANKVGEFETPQERWENNVRGVTRYGGISPGATAVLEKVTGLDEFETTGAERLAASATAGTIPEFLGGSMKNPLLPDFGQIVDDAGTAICTELHRQGYLSEYILGLDGEYRDKYIDADAYAAYLKFAIPMVRIMRKSKIMTQIIRPFGVGWAREMAHRICPEVVDGNIIGKVLLKVGLPFCAWLGNKEKNYGVTT